MKKLSLVLTLILSLAVSGFAAESVQGSITTITINPLFSINVSCNLFYAVPATTANPDPDDDYLGSIGAGSLAFEGGGYTVDTSAAGIYETNSVLHRAAPCYTDASVWVTNNKAEDWKVTLKVTSTTAAALTAPDGGSIMNVVVGKMLNEQLYDSNGDPISGQTVSTNEVDNLINEDNQTDVSFSTAVDLYDTGRTTTSGVFGDQFHARVFLNMLPVDLPAGDLFAAADTVVWTILDTTL